MKQFKIYEGSNLDILPTLPDNSVDAIVTDPPYELGFMGKSWDSTGIAYNVEMWKECMRVLKPGGHLVAFSGSRTYHRMAVAIEDAGFQIRDQIMWVYGSGFPKSHNISKALDKNDAPEAKHWNGWGSALKPAHEPICLARKPLDGTIAQNALKWGVGGINIDACRVSAKGEDFSDVKDRKDMTGKLTTHHEGGNLEALEKLKTLGRFPANFIHDGSQEVLDLFPDAKGMATQKSGKGIKVYTGNSLFHSKTEFPDVREGYNDSGSASRFFYCPKANKKDRGENTHPTVKPNELMRYLCRLVTPPNGIVLDPFNGSGSTGKAAVSEGFEYIGIELDPEYIKISEARINSVK